MRAIDADALESVFADKHNGCAGECECCGHYISDKWRKGWCGLIADAPTVGGWISVKDRLPNSNGCYIVWRPHFYPDFGMPAICYFDGSNTWHDSYGVDFERTLNASDVTHWMPLPKKPKEDHG